MEKKMTNRLNLLKKISVLPSAFFFILWFCASSFAAVIDAPHNDTNAIECGACHSYSLWWQYSPAVNNSGTSYAQISDAVCNKCHAPGGSAPNKIPHSRQSMAGASHDSYLGEWATTSCIDCHNPHYQEQLDWLNTDASLSTKLFLVTGTISAGSIQVNSTTKTTTLNFKNADAHAHWLDPALWPAKSGPGRGLILVIRDSSENSFEVNSASVTTAIVSGTANGAGSITVQGSIPASYNGADTNFALIYGQLLRKSITTPSSGGREVKFFDSTITYSEGLAGGSADPAGNPSQGICQVCHVNTKYYNADGLQPDRTNPSGPRLAATSHNPTVSCTSCHLMALGFRPNGDYTAPAAPTIGAYTSPTANSSLTLSGTAEANATLVIKRGSEVLASTTVNSSGNWSAEVTLTEGANSLSITAKDAALNESTATVISVTLNTPPPVVLVSIAVTPATPSISQGATKQFTAIGTYSDNTNQDLTSSVTWTSSNTAVATISPAGMATSIAIGSTTISAAAGAISGSTTLTVTATAVAAQPAINISMDLHCDPLNQQLTLDQRRVFFHKQLANTKWLLDLVEPYGVKVSFLAVGECYEFCSEESEQAACLPLLTRLQTSGGILGTHQHADYYSKAHDWPTIANAYNNPLPADVRKVWDSGKQFTDQAVRLTLGITDPAAISAVNTAAESHAQLTDPNQMMEEYGYTVREGGADQIMASYFNHVPWNPFRPGQTAISEDLTTQFVTVPQGMVVGHTGPHLGLWQDGTSARKKAEFLQIYANWKERNRTGAMSKVWSFGWGVHTQDLDSGSESRAAIADLIPWLRDEFVSKADATGKPPAKFASYLDIRDEYLAWEAAHPGLSSFNCVATSTNYALYPYLAWANHYMRFARLDSRIVSSGADVFLLKAGDYSVTTPTTYPFVLASATNSPTSVDFSATLGAGILRRIKLNDGSVTDVAASSVNLDIEPVVLCAPGNCDAILALENVSSPSLVSIAVTPASPTITEGGTQQFTATGTYADSSTQNLSASVIWTSSNQAAATLSNTGLATAVAAGTTTITAESGDISGGTTLTVTSTAPHFVDGNGANGINYDGAKAAMEPQLTVFSDTLYAAWQESNGNAYQIRVKKYDESAWAWADGGTANGLNFDPTKAASSAQLTVFGSALYAAWYESNGTVTRIRVKKYDGSTWTWADGGTANGLNFTQSKNAKNPQLTTFGGNLYAIWEELSPVNFSQIRVKKYDGSTWVWADGGSAVGINYSPTLAATAPQLTEFNGNLYAIWQEKSGPVDQIRVKRYNGSAWVWVDGGIATGINFTPGNNGDRAQLTVYGNALYATWREGNAATKYQIRVKKYDGSQWTWADGGSASGLNYNTTQDGHESQLTVSGSNMYAIWCEAKPAALEVRVRQYDGSAWTWFDGGTANGINFDATRDGNNQQLTVFRNRLYATWWESAATGSQIRVSTFSVPTPDFSLQAFSPASIQSGASGTATVTVTRTNGHLAAITLNLASNAQGITASGSIAAGAGSGTLSIVVPSAVAAGTYPLTLNGSDGSLSRSVGFILTVTQAAASQSSTGSAFGVYLSHTLPTKFMLDEGLTSQAMFDWSDQHMATLGAHWTRYSLLAAWQLIEPTIGGGYNWSANGPNGAPDAILGAVYAPGNDIHTVVNIQALSLGTGTPTRSPFTNQTDYRAFVQALAERYDGDGASDAPGGIKVDYFQLANEVQDWFDRGLTADQYGEAAQITLEALRAANPNAQLIMMGGFSRGGTEVTLEDRYKQAIQALKSRGVKPVAIDLHWWFWITDGLPWQSSVVLDARAYLDSIGWQDVQIWSMEDGAWAGCPANLTALTEEEQALTLVKRFVWGRANGIVKLFWQGLIDMYNFDGKADSPFNSMGLVDDGEQNCADISRRNTTRIGYWSYQKLAANTDNLVATPSGTVSGTHDGTSVFAYQYLRKSDSAPFYIVWREGGTGSVTLSVPGSAYHLTNLIPDRFGTFQESDITPVAGSITVNAGSQPILIFPAAVTADTTPPTVGISSPVSGATVSGTVPVTATAVDNIGVSKVELYVDSSLKSSTTTSPYTFSLDTTLLTNASHTLLAKAYDAAGNQAASASISVTVNNASLSALVLVTQFAGNGLYKLDPLTNTIVSQLSFSANPGRPAADLTRRLAYVPLGDQLIALKPDTMEYSILAVSGLGLDGTTTALSPDGKTLAVINHGTDGIRSSDDRLDIVTLNPGVWPPTASLNFSVTVGQQPIRTLIDHNGRYAVVSVRDDSKILVVDLVTHQTALQVTLAANSNPEGMDLHPSQNIAYVTLHGSNKIEIINLDTTPPQEVTSVAIQSSKPGNNPQPSGGSFTPNGSRFYVSGQSTNEVLLFNTPTVTAPVQDTTVSLASAQQPHTIVYFPDDRAYVANTFNTQAHGNIVVLQNYSATPSVSQQILTDVLMNPLYLAYFPAVGGP